MSIGKKIVVKNNKVSFISRNGDDYISLTDIARYKNSEEPKDIVKNWMRNRSTIEFLGIWEKINNPDFKGVEFDSFRNEAGSNAFVLSPQKWIETTQAIGMISKSGRYGGGTYAHKDIAFEFAAWISSEFRFYLIKEFQRLKIEESQRIAIGWDVKRILSKINYRIHTDAIKKRLIPPLVSKSSEMIIYANEADILNMALFGMTAKEWRDANSSKEGNIRDYSSVEQLVVLANLESLNAEYILQGMSQGERLKKLNEIAIRQMRSLLGADAIKKLV
ncbi:MAG: DNA-binding protein [Candidatus Taylorbacteria bacterium RIFCSPHIGHO2_02_FULL_45_28]|uniref:DNA-binding protein n=1 Tax=Candidatus Taylorbacteria bacterium RIFCSPHIGHO2_12_FULL_45_16 TaxID=1802315 RepID=A0A1G2N015_9BACT|nr:MAG: DNA-binding protein [Candidatus Taylorbacteria bacterium RIFCSPHIGHO2_01_FULL_44_110]OHA25182.1 MAG: DNA-binding protein [Candidatus Taylorbacteria bacterium RIFCSPHIGHO2_02_FULL_45_28]OHA29424.1 MAG: DNA-binding protein [Candidatus Taylorbacteria bacterium RIFCSPHIGHO2_12_FULL_45_16]OHA33188.1 MAG: DNA-binding protein [Candidatus Taylorbacteria bacterium RIFCSPLOWO2_01_FULL_45_59]OHA38244.1 MAG: DNA-binding protein [Candidatus Taylorbacteria bacterium RIFCSPLOWO2_02_FULL_45_10b]OHA433